MSLNILCDEIKSQETGQQGPDVSGYSIVIGAVVAIQQIIKIIKHFIFHTIFYGQQNLIQFIFNK